MAEHRIRQMFKWLAKTPTLLLVYNIINEQEAREFIERVEPTDDQTNVHYIPHHVVEKDSPTTPICIVFDCSCRQSSGYPSLNDCLLIGSVIYALYMSVSGVIPSEFPPILRRHFYMSAYTQTIGTTLWLTDPTGISSRFSVY